MKRFLGICSLVFLLVHSAPVSGAPSKSPIDPSREVLVLFRAGAISVGDPSSEYATSQATYRDPSLSSILTRHSVEAVGRACPDAKPTDARKRLPSGRTIESMDLSNLYRLRVPTGTGRTELIAELRNHPDVILAEENASIRYRAQPNDLYFPKQWNMQNIGQSSGTPRADIDAVLGWNAETGWSNTRIGIVDQIGVDANAEDLVGRVTGQVGNGFHATMVAGVPGSGIS